MERLRHWREPLALVLVIAAGLRLLIGIVSVPVLAGPYDSLARSALFASGRTFDTVLVLAVVAAAVWCLSGPATPRAVGVGIAALIVAGVGVLVSVVFALIGLAAETPWKGVEFADALFALVVPVIAVIVLLLALQRVGAPVARIDASAPTGGENTVVVPPPPPGTTVPPALPPTWQPDQASGRAWTSASEAARGEPGAGWGNAGGQGWQPIPGAPQPPRSSPPPS